MDRTGEIKTASIIAIAGNALLALMKITAGFLTGSMAVLGDGIDSASDILTSFITLMAARIMAEPPDHHHPYGHERAEAVASTILSFVIFFIGGQLFLSTVKSLYVMEERSLMQLPAIIVTAISIAGKIALAWSQRYYGKKLDSRMLLANGKNMQNDILISSTVLAGLVATVWLDIPVIDSVLALIISLWVMKTAVGIFLESNTELMDGMDSTGVYGSVFEAVGTVQGAHNPHRTRIRRMSSSLIIDLDVEVNGSLTVAQGHEIARQVERAIREAIPGVYDVLVHIEPLGNREESERYGLTVNEIEPSS